MISNILKELYPDRILHEGFYFVRKQDFDLGEGDISIINKSIGNITILKWMYRTFRFESFPHLLNFVEKNKKELYLKDGKYFNEILEILRNTEKKGRENELLAMNYISDLMKIKSVDFEIKQTSICSREDVIDGIDLILTNKGKDFYIQVKPLVSYKLNGSIYEIKSSGKLKEYKKIHYYVFVNSKEYLLFTNLGVKIKNGDVYIAAKNLKN